MNVLYTINTLEGSFTVPASVVDSLSPCLQKYMLENQTHRVELKGGHFTHEVVAFLRKYLESGGNPDITDELIDRVRRDDVFVMIARASDELGLYALLDKFTEKIILLLDDPYSYTDNIREYFSIPAEQYLEESGWVDKSVEDRLTRSTFFKPDDSAAIREFSTQVIISKKESARSVPDDACHLCSKMFTTLDRRHHCRACALPVCGACSIYVELPKGYTPVAPQSYITLAYNAFDYNKHLVCRQCEFCIAFGVLDLNITHLTRAATVSHKWRQAALNYGREMLDIQYKLPYHTLTYREKRRLWTSRKYWVGHSKWTLQLLKSIDWQDARVSDEAHNYLKMANTGQKIVSCQDVWCSSRCTGSVDGGDALELLSEHVTNECVRQFAVECLKNTPNDRLLCFLPSLVNSLRWESTPSSCPLWNFLLEKSFEMDNTTHHSEFCNQLYWALAVVSDGDRRFLSLQQRLLIEISKKFSDDYAFGLVRGLDLVTILDSVNLVNRTVQPADQLRKLMPRLQIGESSPFRLPIDPRVVVNSIDVDGMHIETSSTSPMVLPCVRNDGSVYHFMFKREDVRKDWIVMNVIRMMDIVLRDAGLPLNILTYRVLPTSRNSGFIEIVPHAHTVYDIEIKLKSTLQKFILDRNRSDTVGDIFDRFSSSMAAYSLVCYILALGDRHKNNIMVREDGTLFHIDYGYILGKDASLKSTIAPYMRITQEMKDAMGGEDSPEYKKFQERCVKGFSILRKWTSVFCNMMMPLVNSSPPILGENFEQLKSIIQDRFRPDSLPSEATNALTAAIQKSNEHTGGKAIDTLHRIAKAGGAAMAPFTDGITGGNITKSISKWWPWSGKK